MDVISNVAYLCCRISISLPNLLVRHDGPSTISLNLRSQGFGISMY